MLQYTARPVDGSIIAFEIPALTQQIERDSVQSQNRIYENGFILWPSSIIDISKHYAMCPVILQLCTFFLSRKV